ncbi:MAG: hypothetical protein ACLPWD_00940 [Methanobacterium sp.]
MRILDKKNFNNFSFKDKRLCVMMFSISLLFLFSLSGSYAATANSTVNNNSSVNTSQSTYNISYFDKTVGGNVLNNTVINEDIPKNNLSDTIF